MEGFYMRLSVVLLCVALAGVLGGGALIDFGMWALGGCLIFDAVCVGVWALNIDVGTGQQPQVHGIPADVRRFVERVRDAA